MGVRLFVGNLPYDATEQELREHFKPVGDLSYVYLPVDRETGKPRGFAFVEFDDADRASEAMNKFNGQPFRERLLTISEARARDSSAPRGPRPPRPAPSARPGWTPSPSGGGEGGGEPSSRWGPDATPRRKRGGPPGRSKGGERKPKKPIPIRRGGRFYGLDSEDDEGSDIDVETFATKAKNPYATGDDNDKPEEEKKNKE